MYKTIIFDMDDTLIRSSLNLSLIKEELGIPKDKYILEYIDSMEDETQKEKLHLQVKKYEQEAAKQVVLIDGVLECLQELEKLKIQTGLFTRNSGVATNLILEKLNLHFDYIETRDSSPAKPDPTGLLNIMNSVRANKKETLYVGDYLFDIKVARNAGVDIALFVSGKVPSFANQADFTFKDYDSFIEQIKSLS